MFKKILIGACAVLSMTACTEDFKDWAQQTPVTPATPLEVSLAVSPAASAIVLGDQTADSVQLVNITLPSNVTVENYKVSLANDDLSKTYDVFTSASGKASVQDLNNAVISLYNREVVAREVTGKVTADGKLASAVPAVVKLSGNSIISLKLTAIKSQFNEWIFVAGNHQGWVPATGAALHSPNEDGVYTGFTPLDGDFKFTKIRDWQGDWGFDAFADPGIFTNDGGNLNCTDPGYYYLTVDLVSGKIEATKVVFGLVGPATAGGWEADQYTVMEYDATENGWVVETELQADEFKFTTNGNWNINLGGSADNLELGGGNLRIAEAGTYLIVLKPGRETSDKMTCTITKQ